MKYTAIAIVLILIGVVAAWLVSRWLRNDGPTPTPFQMPIDDVFAIKTLGKVVVVGIVAKGEVRPGDRLLVRDEHGERAVTVDSLETINQPLTVARKNDQVGVMLIGADRDQNGKGAILTSRAK